MTIVMLAFESNLMGLIQTVLEADGCTILATRNADDTLRMLEHSVEPCILLADNYHGAPPAIEALLRLATNPTLRQRTNVIGLSAWSGEAVEQGLVDDVVSLPFTAETLITAVERATSHLHSGR